MNVFWEACSSRRSSLPSWACITVDWASIFASLSSNRYAIWRANNVAISLLSLALNSDSLSILSHWEAILANKSSKLSKRLVVEPSRTFASEPSFSIFLSDFCSSFKPKAFKYSSPVVLSIFDCGSSNTYSISSFSSASRMPLFSRSIFQLITLPT